MSSNDKIYVQIASYRDPELRSTIESCIKTADQPENLVFCIAWQRSKEDEWDKLDEYLNDPRFHIIDIDHMESQGACWARSVSQSKYTDEKYMMQIDSHHRFAPGWDSLAKQMIIDLQNKGFSKPLLTSYPPAYEPKNDPHGRHKGVAQLHIDRFSPEGIPVLRSEAMPTDLDAPVMTRGLAGGFIFTLGQWNKEVPYDPNLYFTGEEITLAVRSFTHGYDMFAPHKILLWHEYARLGKTKHWDDYKDWGKLHNASIKRIKCLLGVDGFASDENIHPYGLGSVRTLDDYERFAGVRFRDRAFQQYTIDKKEAPNPTYETQEEYDASFVYQLRFCMNVWKTQLSEDELLKYDFLAVIFDDENNVGVFRQDADKNEIQQIINNSKNFQYYEIWRTFNNYKKLPAKWVVWPYSKEKGWGPRIDQTINYHLQS